MPRQWSAKDERQYEQIKKGSRQRGVAEGRAKEIAARTVNKQRRQEGRTPKKTTMGTGNPNLPLANRSKQELYNMARELKIDGRSKMNKDQLVKAIQRKK